MRQLTAKFRHERWFSDTCDLLECRIEFERMAVHLKRNPDAELVEQTKREIVERANEIILRDFDAEAWAIKDSMRRVIAKLGPGGYEVLNEILNMISRLRSTVPQVVLEADSEGER